MGWAETLKNKLPDKPVSEVATETRTISSVLACIGWSVETRSNLIVLIKRTTTVASHKGQVSFPGGFREPGDPGLLDTALRETTEEIGVERADVTVLGALTPVKTRNEVVIYPWVGKISLPYEFRPNQAEVDALLFLPLERLLTEGLTKEQVPVGDYRVESPGIRVDGELVWGATARILAELREICLTFPVQGPP